MGIGVVVNPRSRRNRTNPQLASRMTDIVGAAGIVRRPQDKNEVHTVLEEFKRANVEAIAIAGGDGTSHLTLSALSTLYAHAPLPLLVLLRSGTMNTVANAVGVPRASPEDLLRRAVRIHALYGVAGLRARSVERQLLDVDGRSGFLFGVGAVHGFLAEYYRATVPTPFTAMRTLAQGAASALTGGSLARRMTAPFRGTVAFGGGDAWELCDYLAVAAGTIDQMGLGFRPFPRCMETPGAFHLLGIHAKPSRFVFELPRILRGRRMRREAAHEAVTSRALLTSASGPVRFMIDGDLYETEVGPNGSGEVTVCAGQRVSIVVDL